MDTAIGTTQGEDYSSRMEHPPPVPVTQPNVQNLAHRDGMRLAGWLGLSDWTRWSWFSESGLGIFFSLFRVSWSSVRARGNRHRGSDGRAQRLNEGVRFRWFGKRQCGFKGNQTKFGTQLGVLYSVLALPLILLYL